MTRSNKKRNPIHPTSRRPTQATFDIDDDDDRAPPRQASGGRGSAKAAGKGKGGAGYADPDDFDDEDFDDEEDQGDDREDEEEEEEEDADAGEEDLEEEEEEEDADAGEGDLEEDEEDEDADADADEDAEDREQDDEDADADADEEDEPDEHEHPDDAAAEKGPRQVEPWPLRKLKPHPKQAEMFGDVSKPDLAALAESMKKDGLRDPVEILPNGTLLDGHQRVRAAERLGWKRIDVVVRADLDAAGPDAAEAYAIESNLDRRQLSLLGRARCLQRLVEIESDCPLHKLQPTRKEEVKAQIGERMGLTTRSVNRYLSVLQTPREVQAAFDAGAISLVAAGKVAQLERRQQQAIAKRIAAGESAKEVVADALRGETGAAQSVDTVCARLWGALSRVVPQLAGRVEKIRPAKLVRRRELLQAGVDLLGKMLAKAQEGDSTPSQAAKPQRAATPGKAKKGRSAPGG
jgi:ParB/RepB/Spo0J family partition protein